MPRASQGIARHVCIALVLMCCWASTFATEKPSQPSSQSTSQSPLADAAEARATQRVRELLRQRSDPNVAQPDGMTALHWAVYHDQYELVTLLLKAGASPQAATRYQVRPLSLACQNGNAAIVRALLEAGADSHVALRGGETPLMTAARTGRVEVVELLLARGANVDTREVHGQTALLWAAAEGHVSAVAALIRAGADYRTPLASGFTPLMIAAREGKLAVAELLLKAGVDVQETIHKKQPGPRTPSGGTSALILAVENGHFELALRLIEAGADPNDQRSGFAPLHMLSWVRKPNRGDGEDGDPPPRGSGTVSSLRFVRELVARGADVNLRLERGSSGPGKLGRRGATPFLLAAATADVPLMRLLVELGADPSIPNVDGCTALMAAAGVGTRAPGEEAGTEEECLEAVALAIDWGGDINAVDRNGETAMHGAAYKSLPRMVEFLANRGAKIEVWNKKNHLGWTPLLIAEGYRPGNFKPSAETIAAIQQAMRKAGIPPPPPTRSAPVGPDYR